MCQLWDSEKARCLGPFQCSMFEYSRTVPQPLIAEDPHAQPAYAHVPCVRMFPGKCAHVRV